MQMTIYYSVILTKEYELAVTIIHVTPTIVSATATRCHYLCTSTYALDQWFPNCAPRRPEAPRNIPPVPLITICLFNDMIIQNIYLFNTFHINCL
jgi:hypothetical protein